MSNLLDAFSLPASVSTTLTPLTPIAAQVVRAPAPNKTKRPSTPQAEPQVLALAPAPSPIVTAPQAEQMADLANAVLEANMQASAPPPEPQPVLQPLPIVTEEEKRRIAAWDAQRAHCFITGLPFKGEPGEPMSATWLDAEGVWVISLVASFLDEVPLSVFVQLCKAVLRTMQPPVVAQPLQPTPLPQAVMAYQAASPVQTAAGMPWPPILPPTSTPPPSHTPQPPQHMAPQPVQPDPDAAAGWTWDVTRGVMVNTQTGQAMP